MKLIAKMAIPALLASTMISVANPAFADGFNFFGGAFGGYYLPDGSQQRQSRVIAGASPNVQATYLGGVRCEYRYAYINGHKQRYQYCN